MGSVPQPPPTTKASSGGIIPWCFSQEGHHPILELDPVGSPHASALAVLHQRRQDMVTLGNAQVSKLSVVGFPMNLFQQQVHQADRGLVIMTCMFMLQRCGCRRWTRNSSSSYSPPVSRWPVNHHFTQNSNANLSVVLKKVPKSSQLCL